LSRGDLTDAEWRIFDPFLPDRGERGPLTKGKRRTVNGILWVLRTGAPWRDMPRRYGNWNSVFVRFTRWSKLGVWDAAFEILAFAWAACRRGACHRFDNRAGAPTCSRKRGIRRSKLRSRGGFSTKIHLRTNAKGNPLTFDLTGGEVHETQGFDALMKLHDAQPAKLLGDKGYDSDEIRNDLAKRGIEPVIPPRSNRTTPIEYDREAYKRRNLIERCVNRLKQFRRIAARYEKNARAFVSMLCIAAARLWIKTVNTA
jgi:transposase